LIYFDGDTFLHSCTDEQLRALVVSLRRVLELKTPNFSSTDISRTSSARPIETDVIGASLRVSDEGRRKLGQKLGSNQCSLLRKATIPLNVWLPATARALTCEYRVNRKI